MIHKLLAVFPLVFYIKRSSLPFNVKFLTSFHSLAYVDLVHVIFVQTIVLEVCTIFKEANKLSIMCCNLNSFFARRFGPRLIVDVEIIDSNPKRSTNALEYRMIAPPPC